MLNLSDRSFIFPFIKDAETAPFPAPSSIAPVASVAVAGCSSDSYVRKPLEREVLFPAQKETKDLPVKPKPKADLAQNPARNVGKRQTNRQVLETHLLKTNKLSAGSL